jgi:hypothetical protein
MGKRDWHGQSPRQIEMSRYTPPDSAFTDEDHGRAQMLGYEDAQERWAERMEYRKWSDWWGNILTRAKDATKRGLESVGLSGQLLGTLGRAYGAIPVRAAGKKYDQDQVSFAESLADHVREIKNEMDDMGLSPGMNEYKVPAQYRERFQELKSELQSTAKRLYDHDLDGSLRKAASSPPRRVGDEVFLGDKYVPNDPELQRVQEECKADVAEYEKKRRERRESRNFNVDASRPCVYELPESLERLLGSRRDDHRDWHGEEEEEAEDEADEDNESSNETERSDEN